MIFGDPRSTAVFKTRLSLRGIPFPFLPPSFRHLETEPDDRHPLPADQALRQQSSRFKASCPEVVSPGVEPRESRPGWSDQSAGSFWLLWITLSCPKVPWLFKRRFQHKWKAVFFVLFFSRALSHFECLRWETAAAAVRPLSTQKSAISPYGSCLQVSSSSCSPEMEN